MNAQKIKEFAAACISAFARVRPDWATPHKTIYKEAKRRGYTAVIDGMSETEYDRTWERLFEDGTLEGDKVRVVLSSAGSKTKLTFTSPDLRKLKLVK